MMSKVTMLPGELTFGASPEQTSVASHLLPGVRDIAALALTCKELAAEWRNRGVAYQLSLALSQTQAQTRARTQTRPQAQTQAQARTQAQAQAQAHDVMHKRQLFENLVRRGKAEHVRHMVSLCRGTRVVQVDTGLWGEPAHLHLSVIEVLLEEGLFDTKGNWVYDDLLRVAAGFGDVDTVDLLLRNRACVVGDVSSAYAYDRCRYTLSSACQAAASQRHARVLLRLLQDFTFDGRRGDTGVLRAACRGGSSDVVRIVLRHGNEGGGALTDHIHDQDDYIACLGKCIEGDACEEVFRMMDDLQERIVRVDEGRRRSAMDDMLHTAVRRGHARAVRACLTRGASILGRGSAGERCACRMEATLDSAAQNGHTRALEELLETDTGVNTSAAAHSAFVRFKDHTMLRKAVEHGRTDTVELLLRHGAYYAGDTFSALVMRYLERLAERKFPAVAILLRREKRVDSRST